MMSFKHTIKFLFVVFVVQNAVFTPLHSNVDALFSGNSHNLLIKSDGSLWVMGANESGQLGDATDTSRPTPIVSQNTSILGASAGESHSLFIKNDGSLHGMGNNLSGQLGTGTTINTDVAVLVDGESNVSVVECGWNHTLFLKADRSLWAMGANQHGQLGSGSFADSSTPLPVTEGEDVILISGGGFHSVFVKEDGSLWATGRNNFGQLGDATNTNQNSPVVVDESNVTAIATGQYHTLFVKSDGSLWATGRNNSGQLGDGTTTNSDVPVQIEESGVVAVAAGAEHSLFLKTDGTLWGMGFNGFGQLGDQSTADKYFPVLIENEEVLSVSAGKHHSLYLKSDGNVVAMGLNDQGQLGNGTVTNKDTPTPVKVFTVSMTSSVGGIAVGAGQFSFGESVSYQATPDAGYKFGSWVGGITSQLASFTETITGDVNTTANFVENTDDTDGDGLTEYFEIIMFGSNPNIADTDGDGINDYDENKTGLDPNVANDDYKALWDQKIVEAYQIGLSNGEEWVRQNRKIYDLNTTDEVQFFFGSQDGFDYTEMLIRDTNTSLYSELEKNASIEAGADMQEDEINSDLKQGISRLSSIDRLRAIHPPYAINWYYQPNIGWMWTSKDVFPFVYLSASDEFSEARWIYSLKQESLPDGSYYDYSTQSVISADLEN